MCFLEGLSGAQAKWTGIAAGGASGYNLFCAPYWAGSVLLCVPEKWTTLRLLCLGIQKPEPSCPLAKLPEDMIQEFLQRVSRYLWEAASEGYS